MKPVRAISRFFFESGCPRTMALFRICAGLTILVGRSAMWPDVDFFYADDGLLSNEHLTHTQSHHAWSLLHWIDSAEHVRLFFIATLVLAGLVTVGFFTRTSSVLLFVALISLRGRNELVNNSGDQLLAITTFWLIFADAGRRWSIDAWWRRRRNKVLPAWNGTWVLRMLQFQMCFLYGSSALFKLQDPDWVNGETMFYVSALVYDWTVPSTWIMDHPSIYKAMTWGPLAFELIFPALVWNRYTRTWMVLLGILFHIGIAVMFGLYFFSAATIALLTTFIPIGAPDSRTVPA